MNQLNAQAKLLEMWKAMNVERNPLKVEQVRRTKGRRYYRMALNGQFQDARDVILTSQNDVRGFPSDYDDDEMFIFTLKRR